jgi:hypothetical protein
MLKVFFICRVVMNSWKKLVKVGVWAQVEQHLVLLNECDSTQAKVVEAPHSSLHLKLVGARGRSPL